MGFQVPPEIIVQPSHTLKFSRYTTRCTMSPHVIRVGDSSQAAFTVCENGLKIADGVTAVPMVKIRAVMHFNSKGAGSRLSKPHRQRTDRSHSGGAIHFNSRTPHATSRSFLSCWCFGC